MGSLDDTPIDKTIIYVHGIKPLPQFIEGAYTIHLWRIPPSSECKSCDQVHMPGY